MTQELATSNPSASLALYRQATDVADVCKSIVTKTAVEIEGRKYVRVEGWTSIAVAHGCIVTIKSVDYLESGVLAVAELRRQADGALLSSAEGFVGKDEPTWFGGEAMVWNRFKNVREKKVLDKRADYAIRAMAQTRAVSRVCRNAFAHVVVLMDAGLSTTPAEEVPMGGFQDAHAEPATPAKRTEADDAIDKATKVEPLGDAKAPEVKRDAEVGARAQFEGGKWEGVAIHFGKAKGKTLGELAPNNLRWWIDEWHPKPFGNKPLGQDDVILRAALDAAEVEGFKE